jgi:putative FmdB family regulatory protein
MPTYDYACADCGGFEAFRSLSQRNEPAACPDCQAASPRVFVNAPRLACMNRDTRTAMETNERAQHAPISSGEYGAYQRLTKKHPSGCGCCGTSATKRSATLTGANGNKMFPTQRPWMISH